MIFYHVLIYFLNLLVELCIKSSLNNPHFRYYPYQIGSLHTPYQFALQKRKSRVQPFRQTSPLYKVKICWSRTYPVGASSPSAQFLWSTGGGFFFLLFLFRINLKYRLDLCCLLFYFIIVFLITTRYIGTQFLC